MIPQYISQVTEFHRAFKARICDTPDLSDTTTNELRPRLINEELHELRHAIEQDDRIEILDALCDLTYVVCGAVISWGLQSQFTCITTRLAKIRDMDAHLAEMFGLNAMMEIATCSSNASLVAMHLRELQSRLSQLVWHFGFERFSEAFTEVHRSNLSKSWTREEMEFSYCESIMSGYHFEESQSRFICIRGDGKVIKSPSYSPASLEAFV